MDSLPQADTKTIMQDTIANSVDHARRRRALDLEYERRRKTLEVRRKSCQGKTASLLKKFQKKIKTQLLHIHLLRFN